MIRQLAITLTLIIGFGSIDAQPISNIQQYYKQFYDGNSTWEDYKVIKLDKMDEFWNVITDTLRSKDQVIYTSKLERARLSANIDSLSSQVAQLKSALADSEQLNESIIFLGIQLNKTTYNIFVWILVFALAASTGGFYFMYFQSNAITRKARKDKKELELEYEDFKTRSRESQIKIKRELQTALNSLHEKGVKI